MILGRSFAGEPSTLSSTLPAADTIERLTLENAIYDETYVSVAITKPDNFNGSIPSIWIPVCTLFLLATFMAAM